MATKLTSGSAHTELALEQVKATLNGDTHTLDLNLVQQALAGALAENSHAAKALTELAALREDLESRIRGMQSAISVATDSADSRSADTLEELQALDASELIQRYRMTCARFRDTFPGRLTYLNSCGALKKKYDWTDFRT